MPTCAYCGKHHPADDWQCPPCTCGHAEPDHQRQTGRVGNACGECACAQYAPAGDPVPPEAEAPRRVGELALFNQVVHRWDGDEWNAVPLASEPISYNVRRPGVWYVAREMAGLWHGEHHDMIEMKRMGKEERQIAVALLRCAIERLEAME